MKRFIAFTILFLTISIACIIVLASLREPLPEAVSSESPSIDRKFNDAFLENSSIELSSCDINSAANLLVKGNDKIKGIYACISGEEIEVYASINAFGLNLAVKSYLKPYMKGGDICFQLKSLYIGKLPIPSNLGVSLLESCLPENIKVVDGTSFCIGSRIFLFDVKDIYTDNNTLKVELKKSELTKITKGSSEDNSIMQKPVKDSTSKTDTGEKDIKDASESNTDETKKPEETAAKQEQKQGEDTKPGETANSEQDVVQSDADDTDAAKLVELKKAAAQLDSVLNDVSSEDAKGWVRQVMFVTSQMLEHPDDDYNPDIEAAVNTYKAFPQEIQNEIMGAISKNMDMSSAMFLASSVMAPVQ